MEFTFLRNFQVLLEKNASLEYEKKRLNRVLGKIFEAHYVVKMVFNRAFLPGLN